MEKLLEALKKLLPENEVKEIETTLAEMFSEAKEEIEAEYNKKLTEAYEDAEKEIKLAEATAEEGYAQAYELLQDAYARLEQLKEEHDNELEAGFEEAYEMIKAEQAKTNTQEVELHKEYEEKFQQMRNLFVDKLDEFMHLHGAELHEAARKEILNDPRMVEHKLALDKIVQIASDYIEENSADSANAMKNQELVKQLEDLKVQMKVVESRNVRLSQQNTRLNEQVNDSKKLLSEATKVERKERVKASATASGRGQKVLESYKIISEFDNKGSKKEDAELLAEGQEELNEYLALAGLADNS